MDGFSGVSPSSSQSFDCNSQTFLSRVLRALWLLQLFFLFYFRIGMSTSKQTTSTESVSKDLDGLDLESLFQEEESTRCLSFDMWGISEQNYKRIKVD